MNHGVQLPEMVKYNITQVQVQVLTYQVQIQVRKLEFKKF